MAIKKKKAEKKVNQASQNSHPSRKTSVNAPVRAPESPRPVLAGISRSVGNLLDRTKAYLGSGKEAEA